MSVDELHAKCRSRAVDTSRVPEVGALLSIRVAATLRADPGAQVLRTPRNLPVSD